MFNLKCICQSKPHTPDPGGKAGKYVYCLIWNASVNWSRTQRPWGKSGKICISVSSKWRLFFSPRGLKCAVKRITFCFYIFTRLIVDRVKSLFFLGVRGPSLFDINRCKRSNLHLCISQFQEIPVHLTKCIDLMVVHFSKVADRFGPPTKTGKTGNLKLTDILWKEF